jgi:hypothetical protein
VSAAMIDGNGQIVPMCWVLAPKESPGLWVSFLKHTQYEGAL